MFDRTSTAKFGYTGKIAKIKGFQEVTLLDWEGKIAAIIFLGGCNFRCGFCHSSSLVSKDNELDDIPFERIERFLKGKIGWIDGVVITGGEPTIDEKGLFVLISAVKSLGLLVKLDTNGSNPSLLKRLLDSNMLDFIAMDIKAPLARESYKKATNTLMDISNIIEAKDITLNSGIEYEFRTTVIPGIIGTPDIAEIAKSIIPAKRYCIQQFVPRDTLDPAFIEVIPYSRQELYKMAAIASEYLQNVIVRSN